MKEQNYKTVMYELWRNSPVSRTELAQKTKLNKATISSIVSLLEERGIAVESGSISIGVGRSRNLLCFNKDYGITGAIVFRPKRMMVALGDMFANVLWQDTISVDASDSHFVMMGAVADKLEEGLKALGTDTSTLLGIGVGTASLIRPDNHLLYAIHSMNWNDVPLIQYLEERFKVPIIADTVSNNSILAEKHLGLAKDVENAIYLSVGYGIGGGILVNGKLFSGSSGFAGDVGHFVIDPTGPVCSCGKRGCWEVMASSIFSGMPFDEMAEAAEAGDAKAISWLATIGHNLGLGIANLIITLNPELVIIGGHAVNAKKWLEQPVKNTVKDLIWPIVWERTRIVFAEDNNSTIMIKGALTRAIENVLY